MGTDFRGVPGQYTGASLTTRNIFSTLSAAQIQYFATLALIDGSKSRDTGETPTDLLRAGLFMGKITTGGKYRNSIIGLTNGAITSGTKTSVTVPATVATEVARLIALAAGNVSLKLTGPPTAAGTNATTAITATAASGTTLTVSSVAIPDMVDKSIITPADGSEVPITVIPNLSGIDVADTSGTSIDQPLQLFLRGADLIASQLIAGANALTDLDTSIQTYLKQCLNGSNTGGVSHGGFTFDNDR